MWWYDLLKWLHVMAAIVAVGANLTYRFWIRSAASDPSVLPFVLRRIRAIDRQVANPAYVLILATGLIMAFTLRMPLLTPWIFTSLLLYAIAALLGALAYAPVSRRQRALLEAEGVDSPGYRAAAQQADLLGVLVTVDVLIIVFLMVVKPGLWS